MTLEKTEVFHQSEYDWPTEAPLNVFIRLKLEMQNSDWDTKIMWMEFDFLLLCNACPDWLDGGFTQSPTVESKLSKTGLTHKVAHSNQETGEN